MFLAMTFLTVASFCQVVNVKFLGRNRIQWVMLDSVVVTNQTRGWSETITAPDTVVSLAIKTGIAQYRTKQQASLSQNIPNPFYGTTEVTFTLPQEETVHFAIFDILGKEDVQQSLKLGAGIHTFRITLSKAQTYFFTASTSTGISSIKMVNLKNNGGQDRLEYMSWSVNHQLPVLKKSSENAFALGDKMHYEAYTTMDGQVIKRSVTQNQSEDATIIFDMEPITHLVEKITGEYGGIPFTSNYLYDADDHLSQISITDSGKGTTNIYFHYLNNRVKTMEYNFYGAKKEKSYNVHFSYNENGFLASRLALRDNDTLCFEQYQFDENQWLRNIITRQDTNTIKAHYDRNGNIIQQYVLVRDSVTGKEVEETLKFKYDYHRKPSFNVNYLFTEEIYPHGNQDVTLVKNLAYNNLTSFANKNIQWIHEYNEYGFPISIVMKKEKGDGFSSLNIIYKQVDNQ